MKKSGLMEGAFIATVAIIITKIIGVLYVIPFYSIIGEHGGSLYGYAYNIYNLFLIISSAGIPLAISKITSEYDTLGKTKEKYYMYSFAKKFIWVFSITSFLICFLGAPYLAKFIIGNMTGGNTIEDVTFVIRAVSFALLIVPILSISRGYLQGHKYIAPSSISQVIEQIIRIAVIIIGSFIAIKVFHLSTTLAVAVAVFGAAVGAVIGYLYLIPKTLKIDKKEKINLSKEEKKAIAKKLLNYCIPFIAVNLSFSLYSSTDMILIIKTLNFIGYDAVDIETISGIFTTWGSKLIAIVTSIAAGLVISLIPSMVSSYAKKDMKEVNNQYGKAMEVLLIIILPLSIFMSIYAEEIWTIFYGQSHYGPIIFKYAALITFFDSLYLIMGSILQNINKNKLIYISIFVGLGLNAFLDIPLMLLFNKIGLYPYYGAITATLIGYIVSLSIIIYKLKKEDNISYNFSKISNNILTPLLILIPTNLLLKHFMFNVGSSRLTLLLLIMICGIISAIIYFLLNKKIILKLFGENFFQKVFRFLK